MTEETWLPAEEAPAENVSFHAEDTSFYPRRPQQLAQWVQSVIDREERQLVSLSFIFCSDDYLHQLNVQYLDHDTLTDVITFPYADPPLVEGDIFISIDRVRDNAESLGISWETELCRVMIHGVLHLCGYLDKSPADKLTMTEKENLALARLPFSPDES